MEPRTNMFLYEKCFMLGFICYYLFFTSQMEPRTNMFLCEKCSMLGFIC